jgi:serine/threonine protein kinase
MKSDAVPPKDDLSAPNQRKVATHAARRSQSFVETRRRVGAYRVVALLGEGGMAQVHLAVKHGPAGFKKLLVVKSMRDDLVDPIHARSFMHEARLAAQLNHPNVVQTYEVGEDDGHLFIAMEYVEGQSMRAVQRRLAPDRIPLNIQLRILAELGRALHHAHTLTSFDGTPMRIVHRDISPQNVMLTYDGQVKLLDFGIAKAQGSDDLTRQGMIKGKIDYMAPEQLRGDVVDQRADVFALGVMLWEALTGKRFSGGAEVAEMTKMHNRVMGREQKLRAIAPETPMRLVEICERAIAVDVKERLPSADAFEREITTYLAETSKNTAPQQLAEIMEGLFATDRKKIRDLLEEQLRAVSTTESSDGEIEVLVVDSEMDFTSSAPQSQNSRRLEQSGKRPVTRTRDDDEEDHHGDETPTPKVRRLGIASAIILCGVAFGVFLAFARPDAPREQTTRAAEPSARAHASAAPTPSRTISVRIETIPATARASLDGMAIDLPFESRLMSDHRLHHLEVSAPGFETVTRGLSMADDVNLRVALTPTSEDARVGRGGRVRAPVRAPVVTAEGPARERAEPGRVAAPPPVAAETAMTPARAQGTIESSNPYDE